MTKKLCALVLLLSAAPTLAAADWQPVLADLLKSAKPDFGRLSGVVVNHETGCVFINLSERGIYCSGAGAGKFNPLSERAAAGPDKKFVVALKGAKGARHDRVYGKNRKHIFLLTRVGIVESTDGAASWSKPLALPKGLKAGADPTWIDYDPKNDILYVMRPGSDLYKLARRK
jgi:hypothetical protein